MCKRYLPFSQPVEISVLHLFVLLVLFDIKFVKVEEPQRVRAVGSAKAVKDAQVVRAHARRGVVEKRKRRVCALERLEGLFRSLAEVKHGPRANVHHSVRSLVAEGGGEEGLC